MTGPQDEDAIGGVPSMYCKDDHPALRFCGGIQGELLQHKPAPGAGHPVGGGAAHTPIRCA